MFILYIIIIYFQIIGYIPGHNTTMKSVSIIVHNDNEVNQSRVTIIHRQ